MARLSEEERELRRRLARWLRYFRAYYDAEDSTDAAFARRVGYSPQAMSEYLSGSRDGPGLDMLPALRRSCHADLNKLIERDPTPEEMNAARSAAAPETPPARERHRAVGGD